MTCLAQLKINEVYYDVSPQGGNQFVELYNAGTNTTYLDGLVLTDEGGSGIEGIFQFPGGVGGTNYPVAVGGRVTIAVDATDATSNADWECYAGGGDADNPLVPNLTLVNGSFDLSLSPSGDNVILANGTDTTAPIDQSTVIDGVNFAGGGGELAPLSSSAAETDGSVTAGTGLSVSRCGDGVDSDVSSVADFFARAITPKASNNCTVPSFVVNDIAVNEGNSGTGTATFTVSMTATSATPVSVTCVTSNGTAAAGSDYLALPITTLVFNAGTTARTVNVSVLGDLTIESNETFFLVLSAPTNALISDGLGICTILDDDGIIFTSEFTRIVGRGAAITTTWTSVSGKTYQLQVATNLLQPAWTSAIDVVTAQAATVSAVDTNDVVSGARVYRIQPLD